MKLFVSGKEGKDWTLTYLFTGEKASGTIPLFPIKDRGFGHIHEICYCSRKKSHKCTQYPTLRAVKKCQYTAAYICPASQSFHAVSICNAVLHPVRRCKLIVPDPVIPWDGSFRLPHRIGRCQCGDQPLPPRASTAVVSSTSEAACGRRCQFAKSQQRWDGLGRQVLPLLKLCPLDNLPLADSRADWIRIRDRPAFCSRGVLSFLSSDERLLCERVKSALRNVGDGGPEESAERRAGVMLKSAAVVRPERPDQVF